MSFLDTLIKASEHFDFLFSLAENQPGRNLKYVNSVFLQATGYEENEVVDRSCSFLEGEQTREEHVVELRQALNSNQAVVQELLDYDKSNRPFINRLLMLPYFDVEQNKRYIIGFRNIMPVSDPLSHHCLSLQDTNLNSDDLQHYLNNILAIVSMAADWLNGVITRLRNFVINLENAEQFLNIKFTMNRGGLV